MFPILFVRLISEDFADYYHQNALLWVIIQTGSIQTGVNT